MMEKYFVKCKALGKYVSAPLCLSQSLFLSGTHTQRWESSQTVKGMEKYKASCDPVLL